MHGHERRNTATSPGRPSGVAAPCEAVKCPAARLASARPGQAAPDSLDPLAHASIKIRPGQLKNGTEDRGGMASEDGSRTAVVAALLRAVLLNRGTELGTHQHPTHRHVHSQRHLSIAAATR